MSLQREIRIGGMLLVLTMFFLVSISAQNVQSYQYDPFPYYGSNQGVPVSQYYFPKIDPAACEQGQGQDFIIEVLPGACSPNVVRSDLLEEQNIPVFCRLTLIKVNPLIEVPHITSINIVPGQLPKGVKAVLFHPYRAALGRTRVFDQLAGAPISSNLGYAVVVLGRIPGERDMPDSIQANLTARILYDVTTTFGITKDDIVMPEISDDTDWSNNFKRYGFWDGRGYVRAKNIKENSAQIQIYVGSDRSIGSFTLNKGATSPLVYLPGMYCSSGVKVDLVDIRNPGIVARLDINGRKVDIITGAKILDGKCTVREIKNYQLSLGGKVTITCSGEDYVLEKPSAVAKVIVGGAAVKEVGIGEDLVIDKNTYKVLFAGKYLIFEDKEINDYNVLVLSNNSEDIKDLVKKNKQLGQEFLKRFKTVDELRSSLSRLLKDSSGVVIGNKKINNIDVNLEDIDTIIQLNYPNLVEKYYNIYKNSYEKIVKDFPNERYYDVEKKDVSNFFGEDALWNAADTAYKMSKHYDAILIYEDLKSRYPKSHYINTVNLRLEEIYDGSSEETSKVAVVGGKSYSLTLNSVEAPSVKDLSAKILVNGIASQELGLNQLIISINGSETKWFVKEIKEDSVKFESIVESTAKEQTPQTKTVSLSETNPSPLETGLNVKVQNINLKKYAVVKIRPYSKGGALGEGETYANFSVNIGIEKRAIKLSVDQTKDLINKLDKTITDFEDITEKLGKVVEAWKKSCLIGSAALWSFNFFDNLLSGGEALARKNVMREKDIDGFKGYAEWCNNEGNRKDLSKIGLEGEAKNFQECIFKARDKIEESVRLEKIAIEKWNDLQKDYKTEESGVLKKSCSLLGVAFCRETVDQKKLVSVLQENVLDNYNLGDVGKYSSAEVKDLVGKFDEFYQKDPPLIGFDDIREFDLDVRTLQQCKKDKDLETNPSCTGIEKILERKLGVLANLKKKTTEITTFRSEFEQIGYKGSVTNLIGKASSKEATVSKVSTLDSETQAVLTSSGKITKDDFVAFFPTSGIEKEIFDSNNQRVKHIASGSFVAVYNIYDQSRFNLVSNDRIYKIENKKLLETWEKSVEDKKVLSSEISTVVQRASCDFTPEGLEVQYWGSGPFTGLPAIIPLGTAPDGSKGWYAATKPYGDTLRAGVTDFPAYTEGGEPTHFYIANVGENKRAEFETSPSGDDVCAQYFAIENYGSQVLPGLGKDGTRQFYQQAQRCIKDAARQAKTAQSSNVVTLAGCGGPYKVGTPKSPAPGLECEDFMNPLRCTLLYNLCDPVICPPSRCDLGGRFRTDNVIQTGIIGSTVLCFPNWALLQDGGVAMPICLTGVHAGLDNLVSILKQIRGCLQESLDTGRHVGICDQLQSLYMCEFFWRELTPFIKAGIPQLIERKLYGRGGGEYLTFAEAYETSVKQVAFFTQYYGANALRAFQVRTTQEAGSLVCRAFIGLRYPNAANLFDELAKPESPYQINAWFDEIPFSSVTVPPTSQYKVFWHIFAGRDEPAYWQIYLKDPPFTPGVISPEKYIVQSGFTPQGESVDVTRDFTGPAGYKQLCVRINLKEHCGFRKVTTGFGVEELTNLYIKEQTVPDYAITSERECIAGRSALLNSNSLVDIVVSVAPLLTSPGQGALEELTTSPAIYRRGITRVCSSDNPGIEVEPSRWERVGFCDDNNKKILCWLDKRSVEGAISDLGLVDLTLKEAKNLSLSGLFSEKEGYLTSDQTKAELNKIREGGKNGELSKLESVIKEINKIEEKLVRSNPDAAEKQILNALATEGVVNKLRDIVSKSVDNKERAKAQLMLSEIYRKVILKLKGAPQKSVIDEGNKKSATSEIPSKLKVEVEKEFSRIEKENKEGNLIVVKADSENASKIFNFMRANFRSSLGKKGLTYKEVPGAKFDLEVVNCKLKTADWAKKEAVEGEVVDFRILSEGNCEGLKIFVRIYEDDNRGLTEGNFIEIIIGTFNEHNFAVVPWTTKWEEDIGNPEYRTDTFFPFLSGYRGGRLFKTSGYLNVNKK